MTQPLHSADIQTRLLVSVRDLREVRWALDAGVDVLDVKEPQHGPLGAASPALLAQIVGLINGEKPVSAACGELLDVSPAFLGTLPRGLRYVKFGTAGCAAQPEWRVILLNVRKQLKPGTGLIAVAYADAKRATSPEIAEVIAAAAQADCAGVLIDTFDKTGSGLLGHQSLEELAVVVEQCRRHGLLIALAGKLSFADVARLLPLRPSLVGVRGAVCAGDRSGAIDAGLLARFTSHVKQCRL